MKRFAKFFELALAMLMLAAFTLTGCGDNDRNVAASPSTSETVAPSEKAEDTNVHELDPVTLTAYLIGSPAKDYDEMLAEFNEHAQADLNTTLEVIFVGWGDYETKFPLLLSSGEPIDLIYTAAWTDFYNLAQKGAYLPIEDLVPKYAPDSYAKQSKTALEQATVNGHLYALAATYVDFDQFGYIVRGDLMDKYGMDTLSSMDDFGDYLKNVAQNEPDLDPSGSYGSSNVMQTVYLYNKGYYPASGSWTTNSPYGIKVDTGEVVNVIDLPEILEYYEKMKEWSDAGCWSKSVLSNKDNNMFMEGLSASAIHNLDTWTNVYMAHPDQNIRYYPCWDYSYIPSYMSNAMAIPAASNNPERALMLLDKIRNDQVYYNLLTYGREGTDYTITAENQLQATDADVFLPEGYCSWGFKDIDFVKPLAGSPPTITDVRKQIASVAVDNPFVSFTPDMDSVKTEFSAITNVMMQYEGPLGFGLLNDPAAGLETLRQQLKAAGVDDVLAVLQAQVDTYLNKK